ncbi:MAG: hypothetical protein SangKO_099960 [Sandaracinaceae bacterium]
MIPSPPLRSQIELVQGLLDGEVGPTDAALDGADRPVQRLALALAHPAPFRPGPADVAVLLRHALLALSPPSGEPPLVRVPIGPGRPNVEMLRRVGGTIVRRQTGHAIVQMHPWRPRWLGAGPDSPTPDEAARALPRRLLRPVPADPVMRRFGFETARGEAQRDALRAVLEAPPGSTLVVSLPTGVGKSAVALAPTVAERGTTVVVVPTVALALDQARAYAARTGMTLPIAHTGGRTGTEADRNREIRSRLARGEQPVVFAAPESLIGSLSGPLYRAVIQGHLRRLVIDEAHLVEQWGQDFRPAFQELAGLRRDLLRSCPDAPFHTLLLSATLTPSSLDTLRTLFGEPGPFGVSASVQLRPEPALWATPCATEAVRIDRVLEAVDHLPRPLILYTSRVDDAPPWVNRLRAQGYRRVALLTGRSTSAQRRNVLDQWHRDQADIVVATSAFGLGVDKADVRSVVHACLPETVDRYYQEVGRAGRDGEASVALIAYTQSESDRDDRDAAEFIARPTLITVDRGLERWRAMFADAQTLDGDDRYRVDLDARPEVGGINAYNRAWNTRTLTLMHRAGLLHLDGEPPPEPPTDTKEDTERRYQEELLAYRRSQVVKLLRPGAHDRPEAWKDVEDERRRAYDRGLNQLTRLDELLRPEHCASAELGDLYSAHAYGVSAAPACGGCPACRAAGRAPWAYPLPPATWPWAARPPRVGPALARILNGRMALAITYSAATRDRRLVRGMKRCAGWLVDQGLRRFAVSPQWHGPLAESFENSPCAVFLDLLPDDVVPTVTVGAAPPLPTVYVAAPAHTPPPPEPGRLWIALCASHAPDPDNPGRRFVDAVPDVLTLDTFERLASL